MVSTSSITLEEGIALLRAHKVVAFPTETVYGLGASVYAPEAIERIFALKGRPNDNPLIVHIAALEQLPFEIPPALTPFWPGPLTVVMPHGGTFSKRITAGLPTVGIRIPDHPLALELLRHTGPLVAPSANLSGKPSPTTALHVSQDLSVPVIDGGVCRVGVESTILSLAGSPTILRPGGITRAALEEALGEKIVLSDSTEALAPGMKYRHYAPKGALRLFYSKEALEEYLHTAPSIRRVVQKGITSQILYKFLRECDLENVEEIALLIDERARNDAALMNRLEKASL